MRKPTVYQQLEEVERASSRQEKINTLRKYSGPVLKAVLGHTFDPNVKWLLPPGTPPYKALPQDSDMEVSLESEIRRLYLFIEGPQEIQKTLTSRKREELWIGLLESVGPNEAKMLCCMKDGTLPFESITRDLIAEAFPNLAKNW